MNNKMITHGPKEFVRGLQQILISDTKKIGFLFGAGTSFAVKKNSSEKSRVPAVKEMTEKIIRDVSEENNKYKNAMETLRKEFEDAKTDFNIEYILSNIIQKEQVIGNGTLCGLTKKEFGDIKEKIEKKIIDIVSVHKAKADFIEDLIHCDFAQWVGQANRKFPVEIFTTNYDYLFEVGLEYHNIPYFDGFMGGFEPFFNSSFVEDLGFLPHMTKLWKIHGSLGWDLSENKKKIVRRYHEENKIIVFPSLLKYDDSKKQPYVSYLDRLGKFLKQDDAVLFVCGYSFGDQHINEVILNALSGTRTSHAIALYYDRSRDKDGNKTYSLKEDSPTALLAVNQPKLSIYGIRTAVIGGKFGKWQLKTEPDKDDSILINYYFDEDAPEDTEIDLKVEAKEGLKWTGEGEFRLPDFENFVNFLSYLTFENYLQTKI